MPASTVADDAPAADESVADEAGVVVGDVAWADDDVDGSATEVTTDTGAVEVGSGDDDGVVEAATVPVTEVAAEASVTDPGFAPSGPPPQATTITQATVARMVVRGESLISLDTTPPFTGSMLSARHDIIGDLACLRQQFSASADKADAYLTRLETLAAAAVELGMSYNIVGKASGIPQQRIGAVAHAQPTRVRRQASAYERLSSGIVTPRTT